MDVAILGGGVAGLATAIFLSQLGMAVRIFERRHAVHNLGAGVVCWPNASFVLSELGILSEIRTCAGTVTKMHRLSQDGTNLGTLDIGKLDALMGYPSLSVLREDLMRVLLQRAAECHVPIHYEHHAVATESDTRGCRVQFANGNSVESDIVIGAEGRMNSIARKLITGSSEPVFQQCENWIGISRNVTVFDRLEICDYWGVGARFGIVPVSASTAYWAAGIAATGNQPAENADHVASLQRIFAGWPSPINAIVSSATNSEIKRLSLYDHDPTPTWHKDKVLMIGDAAHAALPTSGQGVAQALEDAWSLAREFAVSPRHPETVMSHFTQKRARKTAGIIMTGRSLAADVFNEDADQCASRDRKARHTDYEAMTAGMATAWSAGLPIGQ